MNHEPEKFPPVDSFCEWNELRIRLRRDNIDTYDIDDISEGTIGIKYSLLFSLK